MTVQEKIQKNAILRELTKDIHMSSFCDEEGRCEALDEGEYVDANDCSCCNINRIVRSFNRGIEFQKSKNQWISVEDDLPCNHEELIDKEKNMTKRVLIIGKDGKSNVTPNIMSMFFIENCWQWTCEIYFKVTHWMPIIPIIQTLKKD